MRFSLKKKEEKRKEETRLTKKNRTLTFKGLGEYIVHCLYGKHSEKTGYTAASKDFYMLRPMRCPEPRVWGGPSGMDS